MDFSHIPSQPAGIPSPHFVLSRDKRLLLDTLKTSGLQENVYSTEFYGWTADTANILIATRQIPYSTFIFMLEDKIQESSDYLFRFSIGSNVMDQRSGDGWFIRGIEILAIRFWKDFFANFEMLDVKIASTLQE